MLLPRHADGAGGRFEGAGAVGRRRDVDDGVLLDPEDLAGLIVGRADAGAGHPSLGEGHGAGHDHHAVRLRVMRFAASDLEARAGDAHVVLERRLLDAVVGGRDFRVARGDDELAVWTVDRGGDAAGELLAAVLERDVAAELD